MGVWVMVVSWGVDIVGFGLVWIGFFFPSLFEDIWRERDFEVEVYPWWNVSLALFLCSFKLDGMCVERGMSKFLGRWLLSFISQDSQRRTNEIVRNGQCDMISSLSNTRLTCCVYV